MTGQERPGGNRGASRSFGGDSHHATDATDTLRRDFDLLRGVGLTHLYPVGADKLPIGKWARGNVNYVTTPAGDEDRERWIADNRTRGWAVLCGNKTAQVFTLDVEAEGMAYPQIIRAFEVLPEHCQRPSPSGGRHAVIVVTDGDPVRTEKLARVGGDAEEVLLAETRGVSPNANNGAYAMVTGPGRGPLPGTFAPARLTRAQVDPLLDMIRSVDEPGPRRQRRAANKSKYRQDGGKRDGTGGGTAHTLIEAVARGDLTWLELLDPGWKQISRDGDRIGLLRPAYGKPAKSEESANAVGPVLAVHSAAVPWCDEQGETFTPLQAVAAIHFDGDYPAARTAVEAAATAVATGLGEVPDWASSWPLSVLQAVHERREADREQWRQEQQRKEEEYLDSLGEPEGESSGSPDAEPDPQDERPANDDDRERDPLARFGLIDWPDLWTGDTPSVEYVIPGLVPVGAAASMYSAPGVGKSLLALDWAVRVARGQRILGEPLRPRGVLYIDHEQNRGLLRERLEALGVGPDTDLTRLRYSLLGDWPPLDTPAGGRMLAQVVEHLGVELVIVDTLSRAVTGEENVNDTYLNLYRHTVLKLKRAGVALLRLDHQGKDPTKGQRGGSAKAGDVDLIYHLTTVADDQLNLRREKDRLHLQTDPVLSIRRGGEPLTHQRRGVDLDREARIKSAIDELDRLNLPVDVSRNQAGRRLREAGVKVRNDILAAALHRRRLAAGDERGPHHPPIGGGVAGTTRRENPRGPEGTAGDQSGTSGDRSGTAENGGSKRTSGDHSGTTSRPRRGAGDQPNSPLCSVCGKVLDPVLLDLGERTHGDCTGRRRAAS